ncbi:MAG: 30S ribosomal protein S12 methylthiotransferase RimO [Lachnospiraceae bacterium]|nr:30S ribosomal protein S12 methylthiotransferase RimO [Lachnospiraceae bacterium]
MKLLPVSLGCDKNLVDSEHMISALAKSGYTLVDDESEADVALVNTCCFIHDAKQESIDAICELARLKDNGLKALIVCGCLAERYADEIRKEIPEVDVVVGMDRLGDIVSVIDAVLRKRPGGTLVTDDKHGMECDADNEFSLHNSSSERKSSAAGSWRTGRFITTPGHYEYLKIADGCNKNCTYCIIPKLRGTYRSVPMEDLIFEAKTLAANGVKELILVAQETTLYGIDIYGKKSLPELLCKLSEIDGIQWIRILYAYPEEVDDELIEVMSINPKICRYIDIPIQSGSDNVLRMMGRRTRQDEIRDVIGRLRKKMSDICIRTTLIAGFPGETQEDFEETYRFVNEMEFDRLGVFAYSREEGTPAYDFRPQVPEKEKKRRSDELYELQQAVSYEVSQELIGKELEVIIDGYLPDDDVYVGRSYRDAPDIDGLVFIYSDRELVTGEMVTVLIKDAKEYDLEGAIVDESAE